MPEMCIRIVQYMYDGVRTKLKSNVGLTDKIPVSAGLPQIIFPDPVPFRNDYGCVGLQDK